VSTMHAKVPLESFVRPDFVACVFRMASHGLAPTSSDATQLVSANALALLGEIMRRKQLTPAGLAVVVDLSSHVLHTLKVCAFTSCAVTAVARVCCPSLIQTVLHNIAVIY
jgi:hypothetical protein